MNELTKWNELEYEHEDMVEKVVEEYFLNWKMAFEKSIPLIRVKIYETTTGKYISRLNYHFKNTDETISKLVFEGESPQQALQEIVNGLKNRISQEAFFDFNGLVLDRDF